MPGRSILASRQLSMHLPGRVVSFECNHGPTHGGMYSLSTWYTAAHRKQHDLLRVLTRTIRRPGGPVTVHILLTRFIPAGVEQHQLHSMRRRYAMGELWSHIMHYVQRRHRVQRDGHSQMPGVSREHIRRWGRPSAVSVLRTAAVHQRDDTLRLELLSVQQTGIPRQRLQPGDELHGSHSIANSLRQRARGVVPLGRRAVRSGRSMSASEPDGVRRQPDVLRLGGGRLPVLHRQRRLCRPANPSAMRAVIPERLQGVALPLARHGLRRPMRLPLQECHLRYRTAVRVAVEHLELHRRNRNGNGNSNWHWCGYRPHQPDAQVWIRVGFLAGDRDCRVARGGVRVHRVRMRTLHLPMRKAGSERIQPGTHISVRLSSNLTLSLVHACKLKLKLMIICIHARSLQIQSVSASCWCMHCDIIDHLRVLGGSQFRNVCFVSWLAPLSGENIANSTHRHWAMSLALPPSLCAGPKCGTSW